MLLKVILLLFGFALLIYGAEILVKGASRIASELGMSPILVGLTVVAFGTSAPELFVSAEAALLDKVDVAVGNIVGSNICNILAIVGLALLVSPLKLDYGVRKKDTPLMLGTILIFYLSAFNGVISRLEGALFFSGIILYLYLSYKQHKHDLDDVEAKISDPSASIYKSIALIIFGLAGLVIGADFIVENAVFIAKYYNVSDLIIGITVVAFGTSLPECAATVIAARNNQGNMALGNAVGSNVFNVLCVIGITAMIKPLPVGEEALRLDFPFMFASCFLVTALLWFRPKLGRGTGLTLLAIYIAYILFLTGEAFK